MHAELIVQVQELVPAGTTDPAEVQHLLKHHVPHYKCTDNPPNPNDSAHYPTLDDIQNHISKAKSTILLSVIIRPYQERISNIQKPLSI